MYLEETSLEHFFYPTRNTEIRLRVLKISHIIGHVFSFKIAAIIYTFKNFPEKKIQNPAMFWSKS